MNEFGYQFIQIVELLIDSELDSDYVKTCLIKFQFSDKIVSTTSTKLFWELT